MGLEGRKCKFCGERWAYYVRPGVGLLCMVPAGDSCYDAIREIGFQAVSEERLMKLMRLIPFRTLRGSLPRDVSLRIAQFTFEQ